MPSFQISITPSRRTAARFITGVRRKVLQALEEENKKRGLKQTDIARALGVHRSVINRELRGTKDLTLGRLAELAWAMGRKPSFDLLEHTNAAGSNLPPPDVAFKGATGTQDVGVVPGAFVEIAGVATPKVRTSTSAKAA